MSDLREKQPPVRNFKPMTSANYEVEISAWTYFSVKNEDVISPKLVYRIHADSFSGASQFAEVLRETVQAVHDVHVAKVVRVQECSQ